MLNGLDLFSGIGGLAIALRDYVRPVAYCEIDPYCQAILLSRMVSGDLCLAPIWDDIRTLEVGEKSLVDILYGGFPCQDISIAGRGKGLEGERSGLFFEIVRLAKEIKPPFIFLENVPAITSRGGLQVVREITEMGYDCRWCVISAASIGALHHRERWFLLAYSNSGSISRRLSNISNENEKIWKPEEYWENYSPKSSNAREHDVPNTASLRCDKRAGKVIYCERKTSQHEEPTNDSSQVLNYWQNTEPPVCGMAHGIPHRVHRIRALGNAVVPQQAKEAFEVLMGFKNQT